MPGGLTPSPAPPAVAWQPTAPGPAASTARARRRKKKRLADTIGELEVRLYSLRRSAFDALTANAHAQRRVELLRGMWLACAALQHLTGEQVAENWAHLVLGLEEGAVRLSRLIHGAGCGSRGPSSGGGSGGGMPVFDGGFSFGSGSAGGGAGSGGAGSGGAGICDGGGNGSGGGAAAWDPMQTGGGGGAPMPPPSMPQLAIVQLLESVVSRQRLEGVTRDAFISRWHEAVEEGRRLQQQLEAGVDVDGAIAQWAQSACALLIGTIALKPWAATLFIGRLDGSNSSSNGRGGTGGGGAGSSRDGASSAGDGGRSGLWEPPMPPAEVDALFARLCLNETQAHMLVLLGNWWEAGMARLRSQRVAAATRALAAPHDVERASAALRDLELTQARFVHRALCAAAVVHTAVLTPRQLLQWWCGSWPYLLSLTALLDAASRARAGRAAAAAAAAAAAPGGGGATTAGGGAAAQP
ncbi:hypothetical protein Rsub_05764 [Raphidocelis subcapitata]|uniref:Uncharacterized protein n=1 Tax=Raphidocelis subcapitata TaxID=307507 RepID=A0A2V0NZ62_9CHLO|nr:hypothetical protein Rsub_05764 [Raphidocelis subcapitata]|eukprot:GBF92928.1 hypothetical protein Rsub_05764 [Raphidocelis subcapitata]